MNTDLLNQFIFADLLERRARQINGGTTLPITKDDLKEAFDNLIGLRLDVLDIAYNSEDLEAPNNVFEFKPKE